MSCRNSQRIHQAIKCVRHGEIRRSAVPELNAGRKILRSGFNLSAAASPEVIEVAVEIQVSNGAASPEKRLPGNLTRIIFHVAATDESNFGIEIWLNRIVFELDDVLVVLPRALKPPGLVASGSAGGIASKQEGIEFKLVEELEVSVASVDAVIVTRNGRVSIGYHRPDPGILQKIAFHAADGIVIRRNEVGAFREPLRIHRNESEVIPIYLSGETRSALDRNRSSCGAQSDPATEKWNEVRFRTKVERARILQEEI